MEHNFKALKIGVNELIDWIEHDLSIRILSELVFNAAVLYGDQDILAKLQESLEACHSKKEKLIRLKELLTLIEEVENSTKYESLV